jgi:CheY-like chemotaxis protein
VHFVLAIAGDLFFTVQLGNMAKQAGLALRTTASPATALTLAAESPKLILVDLNLAGIDAPALIRQLKAAHPQTPIAAWVAHVQTGLRQAAAAAGADPVLPRSAFATKMPALLAAHS